VNVSTVYRTLELLVSLDLVVETHLEGSACYYEVSPEPTHHHFVCTQCGAVGHFSDELLAPVHAELTERQRFAVSQIQVTAFGLCRECQAANGVAAATPGRRPQPA
jgi:Fur family ferric uptake transcriptional regulator